MGEVTVTSNNNTWITGLRNYWLYTDFDVYISSLYFNLLSIYTIGYGDIISRNNNERVYNIIFLSIANLLFSLGISYLSFLFANSNVMENQFKDKIKILEKIKKKYQMSDILYKEIRKNINNQHTKVHLEKFIILESLPLNLRSELILSMNKKGISNFNFFKLSSNKEFIIHVLPLLKNHFLLKDDILVPIGSIIEEIYLLNKGILSLCLDKIFDNIQIAQLKKNDHFGDILIHLNEKSPYTIKCFVACEYLTLSKADYNKTSALFNNIIMRILEFSCEFLENIEITKQVIIDLYEEGLKLNQIKNIIKNIDFFLINHNFQSYYNDNSNIIDIEDFIIINDVKDILNFSKTNMTKKDFYKFFAESLK